MLEFYPTNILQKWHFATLRQHRHHPTLQLKHWPIMYSLGKVWENCNFNSHFCNKTPVNIENIENIGNLARKPYKNVTWHFIIEKHMGLEYFNIWNVYFASKIRTFVLTKVLMYWWKDMVETFTYFSKYFLDEKMLYIIYLTNGIWKLLPFVPFLYNIWNGDVFI